MCWYASHIFTCRLNRKKSFQLGCFASFFLFESFICPAVIPHDWKKKRHNNFASEAADLSHFFVVQTPFFSFQPKDVFVHFIIFVFFFCFLFFRRFWNAKLDQ